MQIEFHISCPDLCTDCNRTSIFTEEAPADWNTLTPEEKDDWARDIFFGNFQWNYVESNTKE
ncbi:hypothetical protein EGK75_01245 [Neisseria weixii]|uniref:Uncharacterized protein n=1 Tax=Neisseria weixii TaxID=1853276 RepID=A0A3N4NGA6_9NEIS|nr:hypothetical protein [Neisseria weixii]RPD90489.1 hypothetical protein EGK74_01700 [Neisseria weixii]RPD90569.1 hypothetical protein EGK75_01245 [Neisseria weixii]